MITEAFRRGLRRTIDYRNATGVVADRVVVQLLDHIDGLSHAIPGAGDQATPQTALRVEWCTCHRVMPAGRHTISCDEQWQRLEAFRQRAVRDALAEHGRIVGRVPGEAKLSCSIPYADDVDRAFADRLATALVDAMCKADTGSDNARAKEVRWHMRTALAAIGIDGREMADRQAEEDRANENATLVHQECARTESAEAALAHAEECKETYHEQWMLTEAALAALVAGVEALHGGTHWCFNADEQGEVYEPDTKWWPCPTAALIPEATS